MNVALSIIWGVVMTVVTATVISRHSFLGWPIGLLIAWLPYYFARSGVRKNAADREAWHAKLMAEQGVALGKGFDHAEFGTGIGANPEAKTLTLHANGKSKTYPYADIREWGTQGQQFYLRVRDADNPEWRISMFEKSDRDRWMERLQQELNER